MGPQIKAGTHTFRDQVEEERHQETKRKDGGEGGTSEKWVPQKPEEMRFQGGGSG